MGGGEDRGLSERGKRQRVCWRPVAHREDEASERLRRDADVEWGKRARLGQCDGPRPDGLWPRRRARNGALRHFDRRLAPERRGARGRVRDGGKAVSRHALQRPRDLRAQAQPDGRADQGDGAPRLPDRPQLLRAIPARRGSGQELRRRLSPCGALFSTSARAKTSPSAPDFDGAVLPPCLDSPEKAVDFYEYLLSRGVSQQDADGIFFENARTFLRKNLG